MNELVDFYMENAAILRKTFTDMGFTVYGGTNAPYVWVGFPGMLWCRCVCVPICAYVDVHGCAWITIYSEQQVQCAQPHCNPHSQGRKSWDVFAEILEKCNIVTTPGSGFGPAGEGFVRASSFGTRENVLEAVERFQKAFGK